MPDRHAELLAMLRTLRYPRIEKRILLGISPRGECKSTGHALARRCATPRGLGATAPIQCPKCPFLAVLSRVCRDVSGVHFPRIVPRALIGSHRSGECEST